MNGKIFLCWGLIIFAVFVSGCNTVGGTAVGAAKGAAVGAKQDVEDTKKVWNATVKTDAWMRDNLW